MVDERRRSPFSTASASSVVRSCSLSFCVHACMLVFLSVGLPARLPACVYPSVSLPLCPSVYLSLCLYLSVILSLCLFVCLSLSLSLFLSVSLCLPVSVCLSLSLSLSVCLSVCLSASVYLSLFQVQYGIIQTVHDADIIIIVADTCLGFYLVVTICNEFSNTLMLFFSETKD